MDELKKYELDFGKYIGDQYKTLGVEFNVPAIKLLGILSSRKDEDINIDNYINIDTFNYTIPNFSDGSYHIRHINGDINNPIFGIDSHGLDPSSPIYRFTKVQRYIDLQFKNIYQSDQPPFNDLVIYGHSLDEQDYSYFFSVLGKMSLFDKTSKNRILVYYDIYDDNKKTEIERSTRESASRLVYNYGLNNPIQKDDRLLDYLMTNKRLVFIDDTKIKL